MYGSALPSPIVIGEDAAVRKFPPVKPSRVIDEPPVGLAISFPLYPVTVLLCHG